MIAIQRPQCLQFLNEFKDVTETVKVLIGIQRS